MVIENWMKRGVAVEFSIILMVMEGIEAMDLRRWGGTCSAETGRGKAGNGGVGGREKKKERWILYRIIWVGLFCPVCTWVSMVSSHRDRKCPLMNTRSGVLILRGRKKEKKQQQSSQFGGRVGFVLKCGEHSIPRDLVISIPSPRSVLQYAGEKK